MDHRHRAAAWLLPPVALVASLSARAGDREVRFAYVAADGCPGAADFASAVASRGRAVVAASSAELQIGVAKDTDGYVGTLRLAGGGEPQRREVRGATCREVVDALALVTVSALGPATTASAPSLASAAPSARPAVTTPSQPVGPPPAELAVDAGTLRFEKDVSVTASVGLVAGLVPGVAVPRYDLSLGIANLMVAPDGRPYRLGGVVRFRASLLGEATAHGAGAATKVTGYTLGFELCLPLHHQREGLTLLACSALSGGQLSLHTTGPGVGELSKQVGIGYGGVLLDLSYRFGAHFHVGAKLGGDAKLGDVTAESTEGRQVFAAPPFSGYGMLGLGLDF